MPTVVRGKGRSIGWAGKHVSCVIQKGRRWLAWMAATSLTLGELVKAKAHLSGSKAGVLRLATSVCQCGRTNCLLVVISVYSLTVPLYHGRLSDGAIPND